MLTPDAVITFLPVRALPETHRFYHEILGFPLVLDQGTCRVYRVTGGGHVGFCQRDDARGGIDGVIVTIVTDDVAAWHDRLVAHGVETDGPPRDNPRYGIHHFYARDPDGWAVEVQRFHDPRWSSTDDEGNEVRMSSR